MSKRFDGAVLVVSSLAAFFATFFVVLLMLRDEPGPTSPNPASGSPAVVETTPPVSAAPPAVVAPPAPSTRAFPTEDSVRREALELLEELGVACAEGADCEPH